MSSFRTGLRLAANGEWREVTRRIARILLPRSEYSWLPADIPIQYRQPRGGSRAESSGGQRVLMASPSMALEGATISQFELSLGLRERGWEVLPIITPNAGALVERYRAEGFEVDICDLPSGAGMPDDYEVELGDLCERIRQSGADLVYANSLDMFCMIDAAAIVGVPCIWNIRESEPWRQRLSDRHPKIAARALACFSYPKFVVFVSQRSMEVWCEFNTREHFRLIRNALKYRPTAELVSRRRSNGCDRDFTFLCVGTICERKGQLGILQAFSQLPEDVLERSRLIFLGDEDRKIKKEFRTKLNRLPTLTKSRVEHVDACEKPDEFYERSDALVMNSSFEAAPRVGLEAAAWGLAILSTPVFGMAESFEDERTAKFFPLNDIDAMTAAMADCVRCPERADELGRAANDQSKQSSYTKMINHYDQLCGEAVVEDVKE